jgi:hypothetical protein
MRRWILFSLLVLAASGCVYSDDNEWLGVAAREIQHSQLTLPGSQPFHLKAAVVETTNPTSEYRALIEEYWVSPQKWRRTIESPSFSQTMVVNGDKILEKDTGDYFPWWLNDIVTAIFDPLGPIFGPNPPTPQSIRTQGQAASVCPNIDFPNDRLLFCFDLQRNVLTTVFHLRSGYGAEFGDFRGFAKKQVPFRITFEPESGTKIQAAISVLKEIRQPDEQMFAIASAPSSNAAKRSTIARRPRRAKPGWPLLPSLAQHAFCADWKCLVEAMQIRLHFMPAQEIVFCVVGRVDFVGVVHMLVIEHDRNMRRNLRDKVVFVENSPRHDRQFVERAREIHVADARRGEGA